MVAKRQKKKKKKEKARENRTKEDLRIGVRTSGKTNSPPGSPSLHRAGSGGEGKKKLSLSLCLFWVGPPSHLEDVFSFACQIKLSVTKL